MRYQVNIPDGVSGDYKVVNEGSATKLYQLIDSEWLVIMEDSELEAEMCLWLVWDWVWLFSHSLTIIR